MAFLIRRLIIAVLILLFAAGIVIPAQASEPLQLHEQEIKAGLLYNFLKYIEWPPAAMARSPSTITVCIFGDDPFDGYLQPMAGRTVNRHEIALRTIHDIHEAGACHLVFINADEKDQWSPLVKFLEGKNILTVSDFDGFADSGGMIEFGRKDQHISVSLNPDAIAAAGLHVEDRLLKLVTVVHPPARGEGR